MLENKIVLVSMPKSATVFITQALEQTAAMAGHPLSAPGPFPLDIEAEALWYFRETPNLIGTTHAQGTARNTSLLRQAGVDRVVVLYRDPRDAMLSWWHHMNRPDVKSWGWHLAHMVSDGIVPPNYYDLDRDAQIAVLSTSFLPRLVDFVFSWIHPDGISVLPIPYEMFAADPAKTVRSILDSHEIAYDEVVMPEISRAGDRDHTDLITHFRRGAVGAYLDELSFAQRDRIAWSQLTQPASTGQSGRSARP